MLSKALDKSNKMSADSLLLSMASSMVSLTKMFSVSVEWCFLFPLWWDVSRLFIDRYELNWLRTTFSQTFDATARRERGRLFEASS